MATVLYVAEMAPTITRMTTDQASAMAGLHVKQAVTIPYKTNTSVSTASAARLGLVKDVRPKNLGISMKRA
jgi:hypothetical protein